jgi:general stress protein YciG
LLRFTVGFVACALQPEYWRVIAGSGVRTEEGMVAKEDRGFASMDRNKQREIASKGGKAAHQKGTAHEWTSDEAREAGRKGGMASHRRKQDQSAETTEAGMEGAALPQSSDRAESGARW